MNDKPLILLVGKSGSGKTTVAKYLEDNYDFKMLDSYTTRLPRYDGERGHIFATKEDYHNEKNIVASTFFDDNYYWATQEQCEEADVYVVDPDGVDMFEMEFDATKRRYIIVYLDVPVYKRFFRMWKRDGSIKKAIGRIIHDHKKFGNFHDREGIWRSHYDTVEGTVKLIRVLRKCY